MISEHYSLQDIPDGPYLGQTPPGAEPEVFAPGIISVDAIPELGITFSPDGEYLFLIRGNDFAGFNVYWVSAVIIEELKPESVNSIN